MPYINLSRGYKTLIDKDVFDDVSKYKWTAIKTKNYIYAARWISRTKPRKIELLHRYLTNAPKYAIVDHIDGDTLNNQKENLRICSKQENIFNQKVKTNKYKGVFRNRDRFRAIIGFNNVKIYLGTFDTQEEAAKVYNEEAVKLFGDFARLNVLIL